MDILRGDAGMDALGWAEDRRQELNQRQTEREASIHGGPGAKQEKVMKVTEALVQEVANVVLLLKIVVVVVTLLCVMIMLKK
jgi:hypothetical protein